MDTCRLFAAQELSYFQTCISWQLSQKAVSVTAFHIWGVCVVCILVCYSCLCCLYSMSRGMLTKPFVWHALLLADCLLSCWKPLSGTEALESITLQGNESTPEVAAWLTQHSLYSYWPFLLLENKQQHVFEVYSTGIYSGVLPDR